jgi:hypothetical protein
VEVDGGVPACFEAASFVPKGSTLDDGKLSVCMIFMHASK